ncbi:hypothetical protein BDEG_28630 [Batrachochytrium dendrobatidis JEL423]|uniref:DNA-directed DNA polymerase n=1 Tax=Batrachochytrium dendrobatidis (strain JEL423) TaxID=403673 RepID=A0A177VYW9_BATDL|nr:hypothetical protein BDEG_28630 [Batrachochytrium dendrobatidis JEL423]
MVFTHTNLYDLLNDYNNLDVKPGVEATKKLEMIWLVVQVSYFIIIKKKTTRIRKGKLCQGILGYDTNALYLWAISQDMPCGEHQVVQVYPDILKDVLDNTFFGMIECDIAVPEHLKEYFAEMPPIFKNVEITCNDLSFDTGTCQTQLQKYERKAPFKSFSEQVSNERRVRDTSPGYKLRGEMMKLMGNSSYGKSITNFLKHETAKIVTGDNYIKNIRRNNYIEHQDMNKGCEFRH